MGSPARKLWPSQILIGKTGSNSIQHDHYVRDNGDGHLVFYEDACKASTRKTAHSALDTEGIAEACVAITYDWQCSRGLQDVSALHTGRLASTALIDHSMCGALFKLFAQCSGRNGALHGS